jgi:hypothetical protein
MRETYDFVGTPIMFSYRDEKAEKQRDQRAAKKES